MINRQFNPSLLVKTRFCHSRLRPLGDLGSRYFDILHDAYRIFREQHSYAPPKKRLYWAENSTSFLVCSK